MNKTEFLQALQDRLSYLPASEARRFVNYYAEMIDDRMEDGMDEAQAVSALGSLDQILAEISREMPQTAMTVAGPARSQQQEQQQEQQQAAADSTRAKTGKKQTGNGLSVLAIILIILGAPLWASLLVALGAVVLAAFGVILAGIVSVAAVVLSLALGTLPCVILGVVLIFSHPAGGLALLGLGLLGVGLTIFAWFLAKWCIKGLLWLGRKLIDWLDGLNDQRRQRRAARKGGAA